jgi:hypothetical protein
VTVVGPDGAGWPTMAWDNVKVSVLIGLVTVTVVFLVYWLFT